MEVKPKGHLADARCVGLGLNTWMCIVLDAQDESLWFRPDRSANVAVNHSLSKVGSKSGEVASPERSTRDVTNFALKDATEPFASLKID
jgi:hypothetical protein